MKVGADRRGVWTTRAKGPTESPTFRQGQIFISDSPTTDTISISVLENRTGQNLGKVTIELAYLFKLPDNKFSDMEWPLQTETTSLEGSSLRLSARLFSY